MIYKGVESIKLLDSSSSVYIFMQVTTVLLFASLRRLPHARQKKYFRSIVCLILYNLNTALFLAVHTYFNTSRLTLFMALLHNLAE